MICPTLNEDRFAFDLIHSENSPIQRTVDQHTRDCYHADSTLDLRIKFIFISLSLPVATVARTVAAIAYCCMHTYEALTQPENQDAALEKLKKAAQNLYRAPLYGLACQFTALFALIFPMNGRRIFGELERTLNRHEKFHCHYGERFYLAPCMQPITNLDEANGQERLIRSHRRNQAMREADYTFEETMQIFLGLRSPEELRPAIAVASE